MAASEVVLEMKEWLEKNKLGTYVDVFLKHGYDDVEQLLFMSEEQLDQLKTDVDMTLNGHIMRLDIAIRVLRSAKSNPIDKSEYEIGHNRDEKKKTTEHSPVPQLTREKLPKDLQELVIPNPLNRTHTMYNNILFDLYGSVYELMAPIQFKEYVISQRCLRKNLLNKVSKVEKQFEDLINEGKSGYSHNVKKYSSSGTVFVIKDAKRAENTAQILSDLRKKILEVKISISNYRSQLFDADHLVKPWRVNELAFYDKLISQCSDMDSKTELKYAAIIAVVKDLKRKFTSAMMDDVEARRVKQRKMENDFKSKLEKKKRLFASALKLYQSILAEKLNPDQIALITKSGTLNNIPIKISAPEFEEFLQKNKLKRRFHLDPLTKLIESDAFDGEDSKKVAQEKLDNLKSEATKITATNTKTEKKQRNSQQLQISDMFKKTC